MIKISRGIKIKAPLNKVFDFLSEPESLPEIWANLVEVKNVKRPKVGNNVQYEWTYKMSGMRFDGKSEIVDYALYERLGTKSLKGLSTSISWKLDKQERETQVSLEIDYEIPAPLLQKVNENIVVQENEHDVDAMLENLKSHVELQMAYV
jgi:uncharacterized membrane protein